MIDLSLKIRKSIPTLLGQEAQDALSNILASDWIIVSSEVIGYEQAEKFAHAYLAAAATINIHGESLLTIQPIHIAFIDGFKPDSDWSGLWALIYSNGAVIYAEKRNLSEPYLTIFIDKEVATQFDIDYAEIEV